MKDKTALLLIVGALTNGEKALLVCQSGYWQSEESWGGVLRNLKSGGLTLGRSTIVAGHLCICSPLGELHAEATK